MADAHVQELIRHILERCSQEGTEWIVPDAVAELVARTRATHDDNKFVLDKTYDLTDGDIDFVLDSSTRFLLDNENIALATMMMQVQFHAARCKLKRRMMASCDELLNKRVKLARQTISSAAVKNYVSNERHAAQLQKEVFDYMLSIASGDAVGEDFLVKDTEEIARKEVGAALQSVFPADCLNSFAQMPTRDKVQHLSELSSIIMGIRLFNKAAGNGTNIQELDTACSDCIARQKENISASTKAARDKCNYLLASLQGESDTSKSGSGACALKQELIHCRQYLMFADSLLAKMNELNALYGRARSECE